jgi:hypothetical protein
MPEPGSRGKSLGGKPAEGDGKPRAEPGNPKLGGLVKIDAIFTIEILPAAPIPTLVIGNPAGCESDVGGLETGETESLLRSGEDDLGPLLAPPSGGEFSLYWDRSVGLVGLWLRELSIVEFTPFSIHFLLLFVNIYYSIKKFILISFNCSINKFIIIHIYN